jgi:hypothetical protein
MLNGWGVATVLCSLYRELTGLLEPIAPRTNAAIQLPADGGLGPLQQLGFLRCFVPCFHERLNLISFGLAVMFLIHGLMQHMLVESIKNILNTTLVYKIYLDMQPLIVN